jgi:hypothetical protein
MSLFDYKSCLHKGFTSIPVFLLNIRSKEQVRVLADHIQSQAPYYCHSTEHFAGKYEE